jgi:hypothetical protein
MNSVVFLSEVVGNKGRKPAANGIYFVAYASDSDGSLRPMLLTQRDLDRALARADANREDCPPPSLLTRLLHWIKHA